MTGPQRIDSVINGMQRDGVQPFGTRSLTFTLPIQPKPSNKRRACIVQGHARIRQDEGVREHQATIAALAAQHRPRGDDGRLLTLDGPVRLDLIAVFQRRKGERRSTAELYRAHMTRPDRDNLLKSVQDGLRDWWGDDCQVYAGRLEKWWGREGDPAHYRIRLTWGESEWLENLPF